MIRKYLPGFVLILLAAICVLTAVGALAAAAAIWLSAYWGVGWALLAVAGLFLLLGLLAWVTARMMLGAASRPQDKVGDTLEGVWKANPGMVLGVGAVLVLLVAARPMLVARLFGAAVRSTGALMLLRRLL